MIIELDCGQHNENLNIKLDKAQPKPSPKFWGGGGDEDLVGVVFLPSSRAIANYRPYLVGQFYSGFVGKKFDPLFQAIDFVGD